MESERSQVGPPQDGDFVLPTLIPGVVDGSVTACVQREGFVSFHLKVGSTQNNTDRWESIEFLVRSEEAQLLLDSISRALAQPCGDKVEAMSVPCCVGVRLHQAR